LPLLAAKKQLTPIAQPTREEIAERVRHETQVLAKISELRKQGLWSAKRLPRCADPPRSKAHWDYLLEEVSWLGTDFASERKWKRIAAKKFAYLCAKRVKEKEEKDSKQDLEKEKEQRRIASFIAKEIRTFWNNTQKIVEYKTSALIQ